MGKANHLEPIHTGGDHPHHDTPDTGREHMASHVDRHGRKAGILMAADLELTDRTPVFFRGR